MTENSQDGDIEWNREALSLLSQQRQPESSISLQMTRLISLCIFFVGSLAVIFLTFLNGDRPIGEFLKATTGEQLQASGGSLFSCPVGVHEAANADAASFDEAYAKVSDHINITDYIQNFRTENFDGWGKTYNEVKAGLSDWKIKRYDKSLHDGAHIFESAIGIGLNTFLTLESIQEVRPLVDIKVFGVDYVAESVSTANELLPALLPQVNASLGAICQGDSSDLGSFVPEDSMDLVFCGYISTLINPLNFDHDNVTNIYDYICEAKRTDWEAQKLAEIAQQRQNDWFGNWVAEMVRITKPGGAVIVEQVSQPFCEDPDDWGGVARNFWEAAIARYGWDIDPSSLEMETDKVFGERYHVFMMKNVR